MRLTRNRIVAIFGAVIIGGLLTTGSASPTPADTTGDHRDTAVRAVPQRVVEAWARNDASAFAAVFTNDAEFVAGDGTYLNGRPEIYAFMQAAYAGPLKGTRVTATVYSVRFLKTDVAVLHTRGGILFPGETEVPPERRGVQVWVVTKHRNDWLVTTYQNTRITPN